MKSSFVFFLEIHCHEQQALAVKLLVALLPVPIRDTLWALMKFLKKVAEHSTDSIGENGEQVSWTFFFFQVYFNDGSNS